MYASTTDLLLTTRPHWGDDFFSPLPFFLDICHTNGDINAKLSVPFRSSMLHPVYCFKFRTYHWLDENDVRVTLCPGDFTAK